MTSSAITPIAQNEAEFASTPGRTHRRPSGNRVPSSRVAGTGYVVILDGTRDNPFSSLQPHQCFQTKPRSAMRKVGLLSNKYSPLVLSFLFQA